MAHAHARGRARGKNPRAPPRQQEASKCLDSSMILRNHLNGDLDSMDGEGSAQAVQAESGSGAPIPPAREVRPAHEVLVYKPMAGGVLPNTLHGVSNTYCRGIESVYRAEERAV